MKRWLILVACIALLSGCASFIRSEYIRFLKLDILDKKALIEKQIKKLYEAKVISRGSSGQLPPVLPTMIQALFEDFPGKSGSSRRSIRSRNE